MKREEAEKNIGRLVTTSFVNGTKYIGELIEIIPNKPFRAKIRICGVYKYPDLYCHNTNGAFRDYQLSKGSNLIRNENEVIETGNGIELYPYDSVTYKESLIMAIEEYLDCVKKILLEFENDSCYGTAWINNKLDCIRLQDILFERLNKAIGL